MSNISEENLQKERECLDEIFNCIKEKESFVFNAGAGAGKTYSLIKALKYSINLYNSVFSTYNQKIMCITYTNVAKDEVKERLGKTNIVEVSTIHQKLWEIIKIYEDELVKIHINKIKMEIENIEKVIDKSKIWENINKDEMENFKSICKEAENAVYENYNEPAKVFKENVKDYFKDYPDALKNIDNLKKILNSFKNLRKYRECLKKLDNGEKFIVEYDARISGDRLEYFKISHDTLIEYSKKLIVEEDDSNKKIKGIIRKVIIDKYPIIFLDEYQDTLSDIVEILTELKEYSKKINRNFIIGYFGDSAQNIYDKGAGKIVDSDYKSVKKEFNRRSRKQIIDVCNKIRNDSLEQVTIYNNFEDGNVEFLCGNSEKMENTLLEYKNKYNISKENPVYCLVLKNKTISDKSGFGDLFNFFNEAPYYEKNYNKLGEELLSNDIEKLGTAVNMVFRILEFKNNMNNKNSLLKDFYSNQQLKEIKQLKLKEIKILENVLKDINPNTLEEYLKILFKAKDNSESILFKYAIDNLFDNILKIDSIDKFKTKLSEILNLEGNEPINTILQMNISILDKWYKHISREYDLEEIFNTIHSTKGLEFDNVFLIIEDKFHNRKDYFKKYFEKMECEKLDIEKRRNLFYVACSRAKKNLTIFYITNEEDNNELEEKIRSFLKI